MPAITINGKVYSHLDEVPPELRPSYMKALEILHDSDGNGIPDFLEGKPLANNSSGGVTFEVEKPTIIAGGKVYENLNDLPPKARMKYDQAMKLVGKILPDSDSDGIVDMLEGTPVGAALPRKPSIPKISSRDSMPSVFQDETTDFRRSIRLAFLIILLLALVGFAGYAFLFLYNQF